MFAENELKRKCHNLSNFTSWKVKNKRMSIFVKIVFMSAILSSAYFSSQSPRTEFKLLVHYSYFEGKHTPYCEVLLKRLNLATFLKRAVRKSSNIHFIFTISGALPEASRFYGSIELDPLFGKSIIPRYNNIKIIFAPDDGLPDLCHHARAISGFKRKNSPKYLLFLNDGVRAPLNDSPITSDEKKYYTNVGSVYNVPLWISDMLKLLLSETQIKAVGPVLSCEIDLHLQGWYILSKFDVTEWYLQTFHDTCNPNATWEFNIRKEVEFTTNILLNGGKVAALFPKKIAVSLEDQRSLVGNLANKTVLYKNLNGCVNPIVFQQKENPARTLDIKKLSAIKYGGGFYRNNIFNRPTKILVEHLTQNVFKQKIGIGEECLGI